MNNLPYSILICSCDKYSDLWHPFFTLLKKYWENISDVTIYLNTESLDFQFDGLNIIPLHPSKIDSPYGKRMKEALSKINTEYVIPLLDDFFLREPVNTERLSQVIEKMESDSSIVCFNQDCLETYIDINDNVLSGYKRIPIGNYFTLNMQVGVWQTKKLYKYWKNYVTPWEWEICCNPLTFYHKKDKFYCLTDYKNSFCNYGKSASLWGIVRGKWIKDDVVPLFEKENIIVDYSVRGFYDKETDGKSMIRKNNNFKLVIKSLGLYGFCWYFAYRIGKILFKHKDIFSLDFFIFLHVITQVLQKKRLKLDKDGKKL